MDGVDVMAEQYVPLAAALLHPTMVILIPPGSGLHRKSRALDGNSHMTVVRVNVSSSGWTEIHSREGSITVNSDLIVRVKR